MNVSAQFLDAPVSDANAVYEPLAYVDAYDAVLDLDYAFVAYKETARGTGEWRVRIKSTHTAGAVFEPAMIKACARLTGAQGRSWFKWGYSLVPTAADPRDIQFRVHVQHGQPAEVEMLVQMRKFDHSAGEAWSVRFAWPAA